jgi:hypothetical protein
LGIGPDDWDTAAEEDKTELLSVTINVPSDGTVVVTGFGQIIRGHVNGELDNIIFDVTDDFENFDWLNEGAAVQICQCLPTGSYSFMATPRDVFEVSAGTHTFWLIGMRVDNPVSAAIRSVNLTAVFYPNN